MRRKPTKRCVPPMPCARRKTSDRKSTRLNSSHGYISYAVFCLKKKKKAPDPSRESPLREGDPASRDSRSIRGHSPRSDCLRDLTLHDTSRRQHTFVRREPRIL